MAKYSKTQQYAVLWLDHLGIATDNISKELNLTTKQVNYIIKQNNKASNISKEINSPPIKNLIIKESAGGRQTVAVMTKEASQISDDQKIKYKTNKSELPHIFNPSKKT